MGEIRIRRMEKNDSEWMYGLLSDEDTMRYLEPVFTKEAADAFMGDYGLCENPCVFTVLCDGKPAGYVIYHRFDDTSDEIGWVLIKEFRDMKIAQNLTVMLSSESFEKGRDCVIEFAPDQEVSRHIAEKCGFSYLDTEDGCEIYIKRVPGKENI